MSGDGGWTLDETYLTNVGLARVRRILTLDSSTKSYDSLEFGVVAPAYVHWSHVS